MRFTRVLRSFVGRKVLGALILLVPVEAYGLAVFAAGDGWGLVEVLDDQVAVRFDHVSREHEVIDSPGYVPYVPWFGEVHVLDKSPNEFRFEGKARHDKRRTPRLTVRARDGSTYGFESLTLQYALLPARAADVLADSGPGDYFKLTLVNSFARGVLRDEFGRWSAEEIVWPKTLESVVSAGRARLDELIEPHGLRVLQISTPQPQFDAKYEGMVERRKVANQEVEHLRAKMRQLEEERSHLVLGARRKKELEMIDLTADLAGRLRTAERNALAQRTDADIAYDRKVAAGEFQRIELERRAAALETLARADAAALEAELDQLAARGTDAVHQALVERLEHVRFELVPVDHDDEQREETL